MRHSPARPCRLAALASLVLLVVLASPGCVLAQTSVAPHPFLAAPIWVYDNWSAYDELSDDVPLTEELAMRELHEMLRLRALGVRLDYYLMDAFWYAEDGGYRTWRAQSWPDGPDRWLAECKANGITPGLWFSANTLVKMTAPARWRDSLSASGMSLSFFQGGYLADFMSVLQSWYDRGIRLFKFDFADFAAVAAGSGAGLSLDEIRARNVDAFRHALADFRRRNPDVVLVAYNGFGGGTAMESTAAPLPFAEPVDPRWLHVFTSLYSGDPRPSDVPEMDFWRSMDIYADHMVTRFEESGVPLSRLDAIGFMIGNTGTNFRRRTRAWQGMALLMIARGGWVNTLHGNLEFLDGDDARWLARLQSLYAPLLAHGTTGTFGGVPGEVQPYGFVSADAGGALYAVVNPSQAVATIRLAARSPAPAAPLLMATVGTPPVPMPPAPVSPAPMSPARVSGRLLFRDSGFMPILEGDEITLGPGQLALVGTGRYADPADDLGIQPDIRIPREIAPLAAAFTSAAGGPNAITAAIMPPATGDLRIVLQQRDLEGMIVRSVAPRGVTMGKFFVIAATQGGKALPVEMRYDKLVWSGMSWGVGEIRHGDLTPGRRVHIRLSSADPDPVLLDGQVYRVIY